MVTIKIYASPAIRGKFSHLWDTHLLLKDTQANNLRKSFTSDIFLTHHDTWYEINISLTYLYTINKFSVSVI